MATLLGGGDPEVMAAVAIARPPLERMGLRPFLTRLDAAVARRPVNAPAREPERPGPTPAPTDASVAAP